jgi:hypothetical protein
MTALYWFSRVNPLDNFDVVSRGPRNDMLCFDDLMLLHRLARPRSDYLATAFDYGGRATGWRQTATADDAGRVCFYHLRPGKTNNGYTILKIETRRDRHGNGYAPVLVHLALDPANRQLRPIGIRRL